MTVHFLDTRPLRFPGGEVLCLTPVEWVRNRANLTTKARRVTCAACRQLVPFARHTCASNLHRRGAHRVSGKRRR